MRFQSILTAVVVAASLVEANPIAGKFGRFRGSGAGGAAAGGNKNKGVTVASSTSAAAEATSTAATGTTNTGDAADRVLDPAAIQTGSQQDGQSGAEVAEGQVASATDPANFIDFCKGKTLTNGLQVKTGSCNGIVMGDIPSTDNMISSIITFPQAGQNIAAEQTFNISVQMAGLAAGAFTNAQLTYYSAPQQLKNGQIVGHTHVTIQTLGNSLNPTTPPVPGTFAFFKGINDAGNGQGLLQAVVTGGLPAGNYRVCTMASSSNHQPVLMPVAQRGAQDDCTKFTVSGSGSGSASSGSGNAGSASSSGTAASGTDTASTTAAADATASTTAAAAAGGKGGKKGKGSGRGGRGFGNKGKVPAGGNGAACTIKA